LNPNTPAATARAPSLWAPLAHRPFRGLWTAGSLFFVGNAMQNMAASWLMIELTASSFLAALVQTASFLPMFLLSLPAGVLADTTDRRKLMLRIQGVYALAAMVLTGLALAGWVGPGTLLFFTFFWACAPRCSRLRGTRPSATRWTARSCPWPSRWCRWPSTAPAR
jgi:MFS family permease